MGGCSKDKAVIKMIHSILGMEIGKKKKELYLYNGLVGARVINLNEGVSLDKKDNSLNKAFDVVKNRIPILKTNSGLEVALKIKDDEIASSVVRNGKLEVTCQDVGCGVPILGMHYEIRKRIEEGDITIKEGINACYIDENKARKWNIEGVTVYTAEVEFYDLVF